MAKKKRTLSKSGDDNILVQHGEKIVFGAACVLIGVFVWLGLRTPTFDDTSPSRLFDTASVRAKNHIENPQSWTKLEKSREADLLPAKRIADNVGKFDPNAYPYGPFSGSIIETLAKRIDPEMLAPQDFEVSFIRTQIATTAPDKSDREYESMDDLNILPSAADVGMSTSMKFWTFAYRPGDNKMNETSHMAMTYDVVSGIALIPYAEQKLKYRECFRYAEGWHPLRDRPEYGYLQVQRSEDGGQTWADINEDIKRYSKEFGPQAKEVVDKRYLVDGVSNEIPALLNYDYREIAGHHEIPFAQLYDKDALSKDDDENEDEGPGERGSMWDDEPENEENSAADKKTKKKSADYRLARFFDPTPKDVGKTYQYRVRAWIADPNAVSKKEKVVEKSDGGSNEIAGPGGGSGASELGDDDDGRGDSSDGPSGDGDEDEAEEGADVDPVTIEETMLAKTVRDRQREPRDDYPEGVEFFEENHAIPTPWSEVSQVTIPLNYARFYTGPVSAARTLQSRDGVDYSNEEYEDTVDLIAISSTSEMDVSIPILGHKVFRGSMLNFNAIARFLHPITWEVKELHEYVGTGIDPAANRRIKIKGKFFQTDALVLDVMGGEAMPFSASGTGKFFMPSEVIVMDSSGRLIVRNELDDATNYRISTFTADDEEPGAEAEAKRREQEREDQRGGDGPGDLGTG